LSGATCRAVARLRRRRKRSRKISFSAEPRCLRIRPQCDGGRRDSQMSPFGFAQGRLSSTWPSPSRFR